MTEANKYPAQVFYSDDDEGFIAIAPDLAGCSAFGETQEQALAELQTAIDVWRGAAAKAGNPIPAPSKQEADPLPSGKVLVRMPRSLHGQLIERAKGEDVSLNQLIVHLLSGVISVQATASKNVWEFATSKVQYATGMLVAMGNIGISDKTIQVTNPHLTNLMRTMVQPRHRSLIVYKADVSSYRTSPAKRVERVKHG